MWYFGIVFIVGIGSFYYTNKVHKSHIKTNNKIKIMENKIVDLTEKVNRIEKLSMSNRTMISLPIYSD